MSLANYYIKMSQNRKMYVYSYTILFSLTHTSSKECLSSLGRPTLFSVVVLISIKMLGIHAHVSRNFRRPAPFDAIVFSKVYNSEM